MKAQKKLLIQLSFWKLFLLFFLFASPSIFAASFTALGYLPGGDSFGPDSYSSAKDVSDDGSVVVGLSTSSNSGALNAEAFRWTSAGMVGLDDLAEGEFNSEATAVSSDGSVISGVGRTASGDRAFRWTAGGGMANLGMLSGGTFYSRANGISGDGSVIVGESDLSGNQKAFKWTSGGGMVTIGDLGLIGNVAYGISSDGSTIVGSDYTGDYEAFRWTSGGGIVGLSDLAGGSFQSTAYGASSDGSVIVGMGNSASGNEAFRWTSGGMIGLSDFSGGGFQSNALSVSGNGSRIVGWGESALGIEAFIWDATNGMRNLKQVLIDFGVSNLTDWRLYTAYGISANGRYVVGEGINPSGNSEAFLAALNNTYTGSTADFGGGATVTGGGSVYFASVSVEGDTSATLATPNSVLADNDWHMVTFGGSDTPLFYSYTTSATLSGNITLSFKIDPLKIPFGLGTDDLYGIHDVGDGTYHIIAGIYNAGDNTFSFDSPYGFSGYGVGVNPEPATLILLLSALLGLLPLRKKLF